MQTPNTDTHAGMDELASRYVDVDSLEWQQSPFEGVSAKILLQDENGGVRTMLVKMEPGATIPDHEHTGLEQSYILEGSLEDHDGVCGPGQYVWRPAGNRHVATSPDARRSSPRTFEWSSRKVPRSCSWEVDRRR